MYNKFRVNPTAIFTYFSGDFLDGYTFYSHDSTYNATDTKGSAIAQSDLKLVAQKSNSDGEFRLEYNDRRHFCKGQYVRFIAVPISKLLQKNCTKLRRWLGLPATKNTTLGAFENEYAFTDANVLNEFEIAQSQDVSAMQYFPF